MIWSYCCHGIWKFSKTQTSFQQQIKCLRFVQQQLDEIVENPSPVAALMQLPPSLKNYQRRINMPIADDMTDGDYASKASHLFVDLYQARIRFYSDLFKSTVSFNGMHVVDNGSWEDR